MRESIKKFFNTYIKKVSSLQFKKKLREEKSKLYITNSSSKNFQTKRNKFQFFKSKLEFENTFEEIKKINLYYYIIWTFLILSSIYVLFFSHYFSIKTIDIIREDDIINIDLSYKSIENIRYKPILLEDKELIKTNLFVHQPNIKDIYVRKILPDTIKILISSYKSVFIFEKEWKNYLITENWVVVPTKIKTDIPKINIKYKNNLSIIDYKQIFKEDYIRKIKTIIDLMNQKNSFITINELNYYKKESELHLISKDGIVIIFDLNKESEIQIEKLNIFYKKYVNKLKLWIIYIDLRVNEKIFYCWMENEFQCRVNLKNIYE